MAKVLLVRHTAVAGHWRGRCYGRSDVALGCAGRTAARELAARLAGMDFDAVVTSPLRRARVIAGRIARLSGRPLAVEPRLMELDFGTWEGRAWDDIHRETGSAMEGLIRAPATFRPGGGETTFEVAGRALAWLHGLDAGVSIIAVCHGGPIAAIRGRLAGLPVERWPDLVPAHGEVVPIEI